MSRYILIETSTALCSCALSEDGRLVGYSDCGEARVHAPMSAVVIDETLKEAGWKISELSGVCVSSGPGSYTGLRVGVSTAKGLCFGSGIPLISVPTTDILVEQALDAKSTDAEFIVPMIDARRMEVYQAVYRRQENGHYARITAVSPLIVEEGSFEQYLEQGKVLFVGDGAAKCAHLTEGDARAEYLQCQPSAKYMAGLAESGEKVDTAYFEPFYLKEFVATQSKKKLF